MLNEIQVNIINLMKINPSITQKEIAKKINITREKTKYHIAVLKELEILKREGSTKKGIWKIIS